MQNLIWTILNYNKKTLVFLFVFVFYSLLFIMYTSKYGGEKGVEKGYVTNYICNEAKCFCFSGIKAFQYLQVLANDILGGCTSTHGIWIPWIYHGTGMWKVQAQATCYGRFKYARCYLLIASNERYDADFKLY